MAKTRTKKKKTTSRSRSKVATRPKASQRITAQDLAHFQIISAPEIAPDGARVVFVAKDLGAKNQGAARLWMVDADGKTDPCPFTGGDKDGQPRWSPDGDRIAFVRTAEKGRPQLALIDPEGGEARVLTDFPEGSIGVFQWSPDGTCLAVAFRALAEERTQAARKEREASEESEPPWEIDDWWYRLDGDGYFGTDRHTLHIVDAATGAHRELYRKDRLGFFTFDFSPDGRSLAVTVNEDRKAMIRPWKDQILIIDVATGRAKAVPKLPEGPKSNVKWSPDGKWLAYAGREGRDGVYSVENVELFVCDPKRGRAVSLTGEEDHCLMAVALSDVADVAFEPVIVWRPDSKRIFFRLGARGETHVASVDLRRGPIRFETRGTYSFDLGNVSADGKRVALTRASPTRLPEVYLGELSSQGLRVRGLTRLNDAVLSERVVSSITSHQVRSADGTRVQTWVMMPPGFTEGSRKKYPGILEIHGGPHAQYGVGFFHEFQMLAAAGYVVVFSNPRGSKGYGRDHCAAIRGAWGGADWVDIQAVTAFMQEHPNIDTKRMGVMGGSYGGYMTNWVIGHTDVFAGAITDRCVSNVVTMGGTSDFLDEPDRYFPGNFWDRPEARWAQSPIRHIGNAKTPTLIVHSEGDLRCNIEQAEQVFVALKLLGVPTRFVRYPRSTSHGMSRGGPMDMRQHRLEEILDWWKKYLRP